MFNVKHFSMLWIWQFFNSRKDKLLFNNQYCSEKVTDNFAVKHSSVIYSDEKVSFTPTVTDIYPTTCQFNINSYQVIAMTWVHNFYFKFNQETSKTNFMIIHPQSVQLKDMCKTDNNSLTGSSPKQVPLLRSLCSLQKQDSAH
jgi:hypothetical protein